MTPWVQVHLPGISPGALLADAEAGRLPHLLRLIEDGESGRLAGAGPGVLADAALATGVTPPESGLLAADEVRADGYGVFPATRRSFRLPPVWEQVAAAGYRAAAVNCRGTAFTPSPPHGDARLMIVADAFCRIGAREADRWAVPPGAVLPCRLVKALRPLRQHPEDLDPAAITALMDSAPTGTDDGMARLVARTLCEDVTAHAAATHLLATYRPDLLVVRYPALATLANMRTAFPDAAALEAVAAAFRRLLDAFIGRIAELADGHAMVSIIATDAADAFWIRHGPGISRDGLLAGPEDLIAVPAALRAHFRLGPLHPAPQTAEPATPPLPPSTEQAQAIRRTRFQQQFYLGEWHLAAGDFAAALDAYRAASSIFPDDLPTEARLIECLIRTGALRAAADRLAGTQLPRAHPARTRLDADLRMARLGLR